MSWLVATLRGYPEIAIFLALGIGYWVGGKSKRGPTETPIPILPGTTLHRGDTVTIVGRTQDTTAAARVLGVLDRPGNTADIAFAALAITVGALVGALVIKVGDVPLGMICDAAKSQVPALATPSHMRWAIPC